MLISDNVINELYTDAGDARVQKARLYKRTGRTEIEKIHYEDMRNFEIGGKVSGQDIYHTHISVKNGEIDDVTCTCEDYHNRYAACKHIIATAMEFNENHQYEQMITHLTDNEMNRQLRTEDKYRNFNQIVNSFYAEEMQEAVEANEEENNKIEKIKIEPKLIFSKFENSMKLEVKIGNQRMYKLKEIGEFYTRMLNGEKYKYGAKLEFVHKKENFEQEDQELLEFILSQAEIIKFVNSDSNSNYRYYGKALNESSILLNNSGLDKIFEILKNRDIQFQDDYMDGIVSLKDENPDIEFVMTKSIINDKEYKIESNLKDDLLRLTRVLKGLKYNFVLYNKALYRCDKEFSETTLKLMKIFKQNYLHEIILSKEQLPQLFSVIMPKIKNNIKLENIDENELEDYKPKKLGVKVYLDFDENGYILADVKFCYSEEEFNPLEEEINIKYPRDIMSENKAINIFRKTGFMYYGKKQCFILPDDDKIYNFLTQEIEEYMQKFEVLATEEFKTKQIKQPKIGSLGIRVENNLLSIDISNLNVDIDELEEIMKKYNLKKKYHKLKNGSFISLEENNDIEFIDKLVTGMDINYKDIKNGTVKLPVHRSLYLNQLLKTVNNTEISKNSEYKEIVNELNRDNLEDIKVPENLENILRYYQKTGFKWLKTLDNYKFGGILADDMGLGKTIQMLSIISAYLEEDGEKRASLVVCPSSLTLNWQNEATKFTNELKILVIRGTAKERKEQIDNISNYDLVITSYDLLKRDIEEYKNSKYKFRYIIADEAQYLKNSNTQNAKSIKEIEADTRYALTGTPIENSLAELWSIFDYIMPGYLFTYKKFKTIYETPIVKDQDSRSMEKLKMLIEPFVLRRTKKQVLTELPEKTVTVLNNEMTDEQEKIYMNYLAQAKQEVSDAISSNLFEKSQIQILAALTRLRQICCHPSLFIDEYKGGSSKLEQCVEIIEDGVQSGHKILLFSGYTSMFEILEEKLKEKQINYFKLTGSTKVDERIKMVDEFNENKDIKVFLISLKAGGTGLNLTGADMVIHYDPWWNASAENQATDRAYRIGQKNNVQVYKLITKNSIEEKIYELQQRKTELIDNMLSTQTSFISKLSKEDIMKLFE